MSKRRNFLRKPPPTEEELQALRESYRRNAERFARANARAWPAVAEVMSRVEPFEDEPEG